MAEAMERPLSPGERLRKAEAMLEEGLAGFEAAREAESELTTRRIAATSCEEAFHALGIVADALLLTERKPVPQSHDSRIEALKGIDRPDLADLYQRAFASLHISCYYGQRLGPLQEEDMEELAGAVRREIGKLR